MQWQKDAALIDTERRAQDAERELADARARITETRDYVEHNTHLNAHEQSVLLGLLDGRVPTRIPDTIPCPPPAPAPRTWKTVEHEECPGPYDHDPSGFRHCMCGWAL